MFRHFCPNLVSRNSTATTVSMHLCIVSFAKTMEGLATWLHTPQKVIETHRDHMWSSPHATQASAIPSRAHPCQNRWSALVGPKFRRVCQESETNPKVHIDTRIKTHLGPDWANHPNIDQLWWVLHCLSVLPGEKVTKISRWIFLKSNTRSNSANPLWTMHHVRPPWRSKITKSSPVTCARIV